MFALPSLTSNIEPTVVKRLSPTRTRRLSLLCALLAAAPVTAAVAQQHSGNDATIALRLGTLGVGLEAAKLLTGSIGLRVGANLGSLSTSSSNSDIDYDVKAKLHSVSAMLDLFPKKRGSFHVTGGIVTNPLTVDLTGQPATSGSFTINNHSYTSADVGTLTGEAKFPGVSPYAGIGFGTPAGKGGKVSFRFDLGAVIGKPTIALRSTGTRSDLQADLAIQQATTQADVRKYAKVYPVLSIGLAVHL